MSRGTYGVLAIAQRHPRMFQALHRAMIAVTGQPDSMATPLPGFWGRSGGGSIDTLRGCTGGCHQGDLPCDCELACDVAPDANRVIQPPPPLPDDVRARVMRRSLYLVGLGFAALGALLGIADARWVP